MNEILSLLLGFSPLIAFFLLLIGYQYFGGKKSRSHLELVNATVRESMKNHADRIEGPLKLKQDNYEFRVAPSSKRIGVLTLNYNMVNRTLFTNVIVNKLFKEKERFFIGCKFRMDGRDVDPGYQLHLVPYKRKMLIRRRFDDYVAMDDIPTTNKKLESNFMVKAGSELEVEHFITHEALQNLLVKYEENIENIALQSAKEDIDPHLQATFVLKPDQLSELGRFVEIFFLIAHLHLDNREKVLKSLAKRKDRSITQRNVSARKRTTSRKKQSKKTKKKSSKNK